jgi:hypothetical protein
VLMEPSEGKFEFAWLHRAVEILHKCGFSRPSYLAFGLKEFTIPLPSRMVSI